MADFQEDSQCCRGIVAESGGAGGALTLHAGMGDEIPSGTPSRRVSKYAESGSAQIVESDCHKPSRKGCPGWTEMSCCQASSSGTPKKPLRSERKGSSSRSDRGGSRRPELIAAATRIARPSLNRRRDHAARR